jgi:hypothetical protein
MKGLGGYALKGNWGDPVEYNEDCFDIDFSRKAPIIVLQYNFQRMVGAAE